MELQTRQLTLRLPSPDDAPEAFVLMNDPDVRRWNPTRADPDLATSDLATAEQWCREGADWSDGSHATWHAVDRTTGRMVGNVSLFAIDTGDAVAKIGYRVLASARGRGVAREMVDAVARWAFATRGLARIQLEHSVGNDASCRVAEAAGFLAEGTTRWAHALPDGTRVDCHIHGRLSTDPGLV